jgi:Flp pilus assembly protein TadG
MLCRTSVPRRAVRKRNAVAAVELALMLPLLCFLLVIGVDYARVFYFDLTVENCARSGALYGGKDTTSALDTAGITAAAQQDAGNLDLTQLTVTSSTDSNTAPTVVTVTVTYPFASITNYPGVPSSVTLSRTMKMNVAPATPNF